MAGGGGNADGDMGFQIAPMIDLILTLLVFFMSTVALKQVENELSIQLPGAGGVKSSDATQKVEQMVAIDVDGSVSVNSDPVGTPNDNKLEALRSKLKEQINLFGDKTPVVIVPQPDVLHARVIDVLNACSAAGVQNISFGGSS
ncbi:MAG: biopolymer transporter ExbD [Verrucomicrobiae bacterium]|nr:biopolymer transporter ExbD [Verrucomicrobiae bacterium]